MAGAALAALLRLALVVLLASSTAHAARGRALRQVQPTAADTSSQTLVVDGGNIGGGVLALDLGASVASSERPPTGVTTTGSTPAASNASVERPASGLTTTIVQQEPSDVSKLMELGGVAQSSLAEQATYYEASKLIGTNVVFSADDCKAQCLAHLDCRVWSWCPTTMQQGCAVSYGSIGSRLCTARNASQAVRLVLPSTCEFTSDPPGGGFAIFMNRGYGVPFVSGLVTRTLLPPQLPDNPFDMSLAMCTNKHAVEWDGVMPELELQLQVDSHAGCCEACNNKPGCKVWKYCPLDSPSCMAQGFAGWCFVMELPASGKPEVVQEGLDTPWISGLATGVQFAT